MSSTITQGVTTIAPDLVLSYETTRASANRTHELLGGGTAVTLRPPGLRTGTLKLFFLTDAASAAAEALHLVPGVFTFSTPTRPTTDLRYVVADGGRITRTLDDATQLRWVLSVDFQEVSA